MEEHGLRNEPSIAADGHDVLGDEWSGDTVSTPGQAQMEQPRQERVGQQEQVKGGWLRRARKPLLVLIPLAAVIAGAMIYLGGGRYEETENAYLQSGLVAVSPRVSGEVVEVPVRNNQFVHKGDVLFRIDPAPYQTAVAEAEAQLAGEVAEVRRLRANYAQGQSELATARQRAFFADREAKRQHDLVGEGISSQAQYDQALLALKTAQQAIQTATQQNAAVAASLSDSVDAADQTQPAVRRAEAALERARLNLRYTTVHAAQDGVVTKVDQLQTGSAVTAGKPVFSLAATRLWVEANFKEDQLRYMRQGQPVIIAVDAFPDVRLKGRVASFSPGTGSRFAVLPAENATGNWVKVVQRLPVEIALDRVPQDVPMQAGLSATVTVDTGHERHLFGPDTTSRPPAQR
ncbi:membrane fusion protein (multidrug efflux system) [Novosphingobium sp. PhB165]|uniref:HlyD family secretion protein n=1 Tax=Novosphingobium sp. PhB165 TaxID=2485105 RepID=UPI0010F2C9C5|nr:HlyD family secretion protein [Novosphingobium sp. PhB165]TCM16160.1 membrane fusion protein (multidrug efflux system) [Novosphingobium sp. PhB165]